MSYSKNTSKMSFLLVEYMLNVIIIYAHAAIGSGKAMPHGLQNSFMGDETTSTPPLDYAHGNHSG